jgi:hypothetical protein
MAPELRAPYPLHTSGQGLASVPHFTQVSNPRPDGRWPTEGDQVITQGCRRAISKMIR